MIVIRLLFASALGSFAALALDSEQQRKAQEEAEKRDPETAATSGSSRSATAGASGGASTAARAPGRSSAARAALDSDRVRAGGVAYTRVGYRDRGDRVGPRRSIARIPGNLVRRLRDRVAQIISIQFELNPGDTCTG